MSNIMNLIEQSRGMPGFSAMSYLDYHLYLQKRKSLRLAVEIEKTKEAIEMLQKEIEKRRKEIEEKKAQCQK
ncbi:MAG: hypothetical protein DRP09_17330 [Candidatus Thorarchaeota archaeon]|nr:MAG: hypothetical protein DRP09_17330 [Candidatus Thorarchaeota archaeon]